MSQSQLFVIVDDSRTDSLAFGPTPWTKTSFPEWFNGSSQTAKFSTGGSGTVQLKFQGTSISVFGLTPSAADAQNFMVSIDGSAPTPATYSDPNPPSYRQWYQSPLLPEGTHNLFLSQVAGASIDFATVTVGENTPLTNQLVIADNDDSGFSFSGKWKRSQAQFNSGPRPDGNPYHNSTHQTNYIGDTFTYSFSGGSLAIYGIFSWSYVGLITLSFDLDGQGLSQTFQVTAETPQFKSELGQQQNFLFKSFDFLSPGNHTLAVNVTDCVNQTFVFDYLTYTPSFANLASMPNLTQPASSPNDKNSSKKSLLGPLVGAAAGVIILLLLGGLVFIFRRRRHGKGKYKPLNSQRNSGTNLPSANRQTTIASFVVGTETIDLPQRGTAQYSDISYVTSPVQTPPQPPLQPVRRRPDMPPSPQASENVSVVNPVSSQNLTTGSSSSDVYGLPPSYDETTRRR